MSTTVPLPLQPKSVSHLPKELLEHITAHLPITSALSLLTTSKLLSHPSENRIWSTLNLTVPHHTGEYPLVQPFHHGDHQYCHWAQAEARRAEDRGRTATREKIQQIMMSCNERRLGYVKEVIIEDRAGANGAAVQLLAMVGNRRLEKLVVRPPLKHVFEDKWEPAYYDTFYGKLLDVGLRDMCFGSLKSLDITFRSIDYAHSIQAIVSLAPNIEKIKLQGDGPLRNHFGDDCECIACPHDSLRNIPSLPNLYDIDIVLSKDDDNDMPTGVSDILVETHNVQRLRIGHEFFDKPDSYHDNMSGAEESIFGQTMNVQRLEWFMSGLGALTEQLCTEGVDSCMRTLVVDDKIASRAHERIEFVHIPPVDTLETLLIRVRYRSSKYTATPRSSLTLFPDITSDAQSIHPAVLKRLSTAPALTHIQYYPRKEDSPNLVDPAKWQTKGIRGSIIRSLCATPDGDGPHLVHIRSFSYSVPSTSTTAADPHWTKERAFWDPPAIEDETNASAVVGSVGVNTRPVDTLKEFWTMDECEWEDMTDFMGHVVPLSILKKMRRAAGLKFGEEWKGRGVDVGEKAWAVLQEWAKEQGIGQVANEEVIEAVEEIPEEVEPVYDDDIPIELDDESV